MSLPKIEPEWYKDGALKKDGTRECIRHFANLLEKGEQAEALSEAWLASMSPLVKDSGLHILEFKDFLTWAVQDNVHDIGGMNSVANLRKSKDPMSTLVKMFEAIFREYSSQKAVDIARRRVNVMSLPDDIAYWLMRGPGINRPLAGWDSAEQKLASIKRNWYGTGWEDMPDPDIPVKEIFDEYVKFLDETKVGDDDQDESKKRKHSRSV